MARKLVLTLLVLVLGLSLSFADAAAGAKKGVSVVKGSLTVWGKQAQYHGEGALCPSTTCNVSKVKTRFDLAGAMNQQAGNRCVGVGRAALKITWPNGTISSAYLDIFPVTGRLMTGFGSVLTGPLAPAKVVLTIWAMGDPCTAPAQISGLVAIA